MVARVAQEGEHQDLQAMRAAMVLHAWGGQPAARRPPPPIRMPRALGPTTLLTEALYHVNDRLP